MGKLRIPIRSDSRGYSTKHAIMEYLDKNSDEYVYTDFGVVSINDDTAASYVAREVAKSVSSKEYERGIVVDGLGIITSIEANKVNGVRAISASLMLVAEKSVQDYNANILCIASDINMGDSPEEIVNIWLKAKHKK